MKFDNNQDRPGEASRMATLDLGKYGLSHIAGKNLWELTDSELDQLMDAFVQEDIAPALDLPTRPEIIGALLNSSYCRDCGKCCLGVNTSNPLHPGIEVYEDELKLMGKHAHISYKSLKKQTSTGQVLRNPENPGEVATTRWLAFPCMFYDRKLKQCRVYQTRPLVCKIYPITIENSICVKVNCEYGRDIYRSYVAELRNKVHFSFPETLSEK